MYQKTMEFPMINKLICKNKSPNNKKEYFSKILNKKDYKNANNQKIKIKNLNNIEEKNTASKINLLDKNKTKNYIRKKTPTNKSKKKQSKNIKKNLKDREMSSLNSNLSIYKIINSKEIKNNNKKAAKQSSSITTDSAISYVSNTSNKTSNKISNNKCISLLNKNDSSKRNRIDSDISNNSSSKRNFYTNYNKEKSEKNGGNKCFNLSNNINNKNNISKNNIKWKDLNQNKKLGIIKTKIIRNIKNENNIIEMPKKEDKNDFKIKINNNMTRNKGDYNIIYNQNINNKNLFINKNSIRKKSNKKINNKKINDNKNSYTYNNDKILNLNNNNSNNNSNNNNNCKPCDLNQIYYTEIKYPNSYNNNIINKQIKNENDIYGKINLNPVKKSLFSEHMNFLINHNQEDKNIYYNNFDINNNNNNIIKFQFNNILDSTDKKDYESKFINYDLGKTTGTSLSKESFFLFGNKNNIDKNKNSKIMKMPIKQNLEINLEEKERTHEELEKLAKEYINKSKYWENKDDYYKQKINQTNTITTVIDDNNSFEDTIL